MKKGVMSSFIRSCGSGLAFGVPGEPKEETVGLNHMVREKGLATDAVITGIDRKHDRPLRVSIFFVA
jgi:hypothetical protein